MTGPIHDDPFGPGKLDALLDFDIDGDDLLDEQWFPELAAAAAAVTGTPAIGMELARASAIGFDDSLAETVLRDEHLLAQLRRHWATNGVSPIVTAHATEPTPSGRLHLRLIEAAGPAEGTRASVIPLRPPTTPTDDVPVESTVSGSVIEGPWALSPHVPLSRAADSEENRTAKSYTATHPEWGLIFTQTPTSTGDAIIEISLRPDLVPVDLIRVEIGDDVRLLVVRTRKGAATASTKVRGEHAWGEVAVRVFRPIAATALTARDADLVSSEVRRASIPEQRRWEALADTPGLSQPVAAAITEALR